MRAHQAHYPVATQCRLLGVSTSGYYAWQQRGTSARAKTDQGLLVMVQAIHTGSRVAHMVHQGYTRSSPPKGFVWGASELPA